MPNPLPGWVRIHGGVERYRYPLGNGRMLMVIGHTARKWYFGECAEVRFTRFRPAGRATSMRKAMEAALLLHDILQEDSDGHHSTRTDLAGSEPHR